MTNERDIDRLLDLWLIDGPTEVADRVVLDVAVRMNANPSDLRGAFLGGPPSCPAPSAGPRSSWPSR